VQGYYYVPENRDFPPIAMNASVVPIASFRAVFKAKSGKREDGGLYTPLTDL
jgi:hypothetical protein